MRVLVVISKCREVAEGFVNLVTSLSNPYEYLYSMYDGPVLDKSNDKIFVRSSESRDHILLLSKSGIVTDVCCTEDLGQEEKSEVYNRYCYKRHGVTYRTPLEVLGDCGLN